MATGGFVRSVDNSSVIIYEYSCSPCTANDSHTDAYHFCIDCEEHFCQKCLKDHNKFAKMRAHQVLDKTAMAALGPQQKLSLPAEKCGDHPHNIIDTYCPRCDTICCGTCVSIYHRYCERMIYLPKAAAGVQKSKAYIDTKSALPNIQKQLNEKKNEMEPDINAIDKEGDDMLNQVKAIRELLNKKLDELEKRASDVVKYKTKLDRNRVTSNLRSLEEMISKLETTFDKLKNTNSDNESHIFVYFKTGQKIKAEAETLLMKLNTEPVRSPSEFIKKEGFKEYVSNHRSIGEIVHHNKVITASSFGEINVKVREDSKSCDISCICQIQDGTILITDISNKNMKRLDSSYKVSDICRLPGKPSAVCTTGYKKVAIALLSQRVQFVSVQNTIELDNSFSVNFEPQGIAFNADKLYLTRISPGGLFIYSNKGSLLSTIEHDTSGHPILTCPRHLIINEDQTNVLVADENKGIVTFDLQGTQMSAFTDPELKTARGVCNGRDETIFVTGISSSNIIQFNSRGHKLLQKKDGTQRPHSVCWDRKNSRLVVSMERTDRIKVYDYKFKDEYCAYLDKSYQGLMSAYCSM